MARDAVQRRRACGPVPGIDLSLDDPECVRRVEAIGVDRGDGRLAAVAAGAQREREDEGADSR
jgi:hypothetical protein